MQTNGGITYKYIANSLHVFTWSAKVTSLVSSSYKCYNADVLLSIDNSTASFRPIPSHFGNFSVLKKLTSTNLFQIE